MFNAVNAAAGVGTNLVSAATTKASGDANTQIAIGGLNDATDRQIRMNNAKEENNYKKIPSGAGATASSEAARTAVQ